MAKILQVRIVEGEYVVREGVPVLEVHHEIDERSLVYESLAVGAMRFGRLKAEIDRMDDLGEGKLEKPAMGGRRPKVSG